MVKTSISLLPQSPNGVLQSSFDQLRVLMLKKTLIDIAISALEHFLNYQDTYEFDGHVGETLCQIRAYHVYSLKLNSEYSYNHSTATKKIKELKQLSYKLNEVIHHYQTNAVRAIRPQSVADLFNSQDLICTFSELELNLIQLHLLSKFKYFNSEMIASIDYKKMCEMFNISKHMARRIIHEYQINASKNSVNFIHSLITKQNNCEASKVIFKELKKTDEEERYVLPCFWVIDVLYKDMLKKKCPILVVCKRIFGDQHIDTVLITFKPSSIFQNEYEYCQLDTINPTNLCFVLEGVAIYNSLDQVPDKTQYKNLFIKHGIKNILYANMAVHPQYAGKKLSQYKDTPYLDILKEKMYSFRAVDNEITILEKIHYNQQKMKNYALKIGCGKQNPRVFYIRHVFCDAFMNQIKLNESETSKSLALTETMGNWKKDYLPIQGFHLIASQSQPNSN